MSNEKEYAYGETAPTVFVRDGSASWLRQLGGMTSGLGGREGNKADTIGFFALATSDGPVAAEDLRLVSARFGKRDARLTWKTDDEALALRSHWTLDSSTGIWRRRDHIENLSRRERILGRCLARFVFDSGHYEFYSQNSRWCIENQGCWQDIIHGTLAIGSEGGRTTQGATPYACLRNRETGRAVAFHILPRGDWVLRVRARTDANVQPQAIVEAGLSDEDLRLRLRPGDSLDLPEILIQPLPDGTPESGTADLHTHLLTREYRGAKVNAPVVYNTWFHEFDHLSPERLRAQLGAARTIGCEVFTIDAGWFGRHPDRDWHKLVGDWRETRTRAFAGGMRGFADEVRAAGLGFGLWIEPERVCPGSPILARHPRWFLPGPGTGFWYPDLQQKGARNWVMREIARLVETYDLRWMKIDFNAEIGPDPYGTSLAGYYDEWYRLIDELCHRYPQVFFEGCASGGMRLDIESLRHGDGHFLTDTVEPVDVLRIWQGAMLRLPPGRFTRWCVLRNAGRVVCPFGSAPESAPDTILAPAKATWERSVSVDPDFAALCALPGILGFSGDLAGLPDDVKSRLAGHVRFYRRWRRLIAGSAAHLLTPVCPIEDRSGWVGVQLSHPRRADSLVFVYRLDATRDRTCLRLCGLREGERYSVETSDGTEYHIATGAELLRIGLTVRLQRTNTAAVFVVSRQKD